MMTAADMLSSANGKSVAHSTKGEKLLNDYIVDAHKTKKVNIYSQILNSTSIFVQSSLPPPYSRIPF